MNRKLALLLAATGVGLLTLIVFLPSRHGAFLNWDDDALILHNADFRGLGWTQLHWMFTTTYMGHYQPLTWLSFALNFDAGRLDPGGYHLANILLHAAAAALVFAIAWRVFAITLPATGENARLFASIVAALLFALHPLRVESVAWITERRDVLSAVFLLASIWAWLAYATGGRRSRWCYLVSIGLLALSLLSKAWGMTLFAVLLVLDFYPLRRWSRAHAGRLLLEKLPPIILGLAAAAIALRAQTSSVMVERERGWDYRILQSFYGLAFYPWKTLFPIGLSPIYEHPAHLSITQPRILGAMLFVVGATAALIAFRRRWPAGLAAWAIYGIVVSPVIGFVQAGPQFVADRYSYLACIPFAVLLAAGLADVANRKYAKLIGMMSSAVLVVLVVLSSRQIPIWRDSWSLWRAAAEHDSRSWNANTNLGALYFKADDFAAAERYYRAAQAALPDFALPTVNLAWCLGRMGKNEESLALFRKAAAMDSVSTNDLLMIGNGLTLIKQPVDACKVFERMIQQNPNDAEPHFRLAGLLQDSGDSAGAIEQFRKVVELLDATFATGTIDLKHDLLAAIYANSCRQLMVLYARQGNSTSAAAYRRKLAEIAVRDGSAQGASGGR